MKYGEKRGKDLAMLCSINYLYHRSFGELHITYKTVDKLEKNRYSGVLRQQ